ncbi:MFS transporter [Amycolatopsis panacis]|uniref:MFS transporter n=1 Tax=Amycolatopsis panacis TaxID=2340917 RepID=A0A419IA24_9PSEU|nr:aromatic acid/H+ symport family MFS transporter [Amycolatopsis panacis]RJQ90024.1 MFS transporter [Amycolatopsis panacis]
MATNTRNGWVRPLCWTAVLLDGFDLVVLGVVLPVLLGTRIWGMTPAPGTLISTVGLAGMTIGALTIGTITDVIGRRKALILSVTAFSAFTLLCAFAPSAGMFATLRFLAGLGLGGCLPTAITLVTDHQADQGRGPSASTTVMTGYHVGAVLTALLGILFIEPFGWRAMFVAGSLPALVLVPLMVKHLPESASFQRLHRAATPPARAGREAVAGLFRGGLLQATLAFWCTTFLGLMLVFGLNIWLPQIMRQAGYPLGTALALLLALNLGAVAGMIAAGSLADRRGLRGSTVCWFLGAGALLALLVVKLPMVGLYPVIFFAGFFVFSAQALTYAYTQHVYPEHNRATGLGWTAGVGRLGAICGPLLGGAMLTAGIAYPWGFYAFSAIGLLAAASIAVVHVRPNQALDASQCRR